MAGAAIRTILPGHHHADICAISNLSIPSPLALGSFTTAPILSCSLDAQSGALKITSVSVGTGTQMVHVAATAAKTAASPITVSSNNSDSPTSVLSSVVYDWTGVAEKAPWQKKSAAAIAGLDSGTQRSGMWMDPAAFDCFLQLGQVFMSGSSNEVYVPAGLDALLVRSGASQLTQERAGSWGSTLPVAAHTGDAISDFVLRNNLSDVVCTISELQAKSMGKTGAALQTNSSSNVLQHADSLYEVCWQATGLAQGLLPGQCLWELNQNTIQDAPAVVSASAIAAVQQNLASSAAIQLQVQAPPSATPHCSTAASTSNQTMSQALSGLVKTLNQECPQVSWSTAATDSFSAGSERTAGARLVRLDAPPTGIDAFGVSSSAGAGYAPLIMPSVAVPTLEAHHLMPQPRGSLNSLVPLKVDLDAKLGADQVLLQVKAVGLNFRYFFV